MPKYWKSLSCIKDNEEDTEDIKEKKEFLRRIAADRKPYFFIYNYDHLYSRYNKYMQQVRSSCYREFGIEFDNLYKSYLNHEEITEDQRTFVEYYKKYLPVDMSPCTVNRLCWNIENSIDVGKAPEADRLFDYHLLKSEQGYTNEEYTEVRSYLAKEYEGYKSGMKDLLARMREERVHGTDKANLIAEYNRIFITRMKLISGNEALCCDVLLDLAYKNNGSKKFVWEMCGQQIIKNLLERHGYEISYPVPATDEPGEFLYKGIEYRMDTVVAEIQQVEEE